MNFVNMRGEKLLNWITQDIKKGISKQEIIDKLLKAGYRSKDFDHHFIKIENINKRKKIRNILVISTIIISIMGILIMNFDNQSGQVEGYIEKGWTYYDNEQYDLAIDEFKKALELSPDYSMIHRSLGWVYLEIEEYESASKYIESALQLDPADSWAHLGLGTLYYHKFYGENKYREAIVEIENHVENIGAIKNLHRFYQMLGSSYFRLGEFEQAELFFQKT